MGSLHSNKPREAATGVEAAQRGGDQQRHQAKAPSDPKPHDSGTGTQPCPAQLAPGGRTQIPSLGQPVMSRVPKGNAGPPVFPIRRNTCLLDTSKASPPFPDAASIFLVFTQHLTFLPCSPSPHTAASTHQKLIPWKLSLGAISTSYYARCAGPAQCYLAPYSREDS